MSLTHVTDTRSYLTGMDQKEWKYRRGIFYMGKEPDEFDDLLEETDLEVVERFEPEDIVKDAVSYLTEHRDELYYPGKSYAVAVVYAVKIQEHFGDDMWEVLQDEDLLFDDPYFEPYNINTSDMYEAIVEQVEKINGFELDENLPYLERTIEYFEQEFMLDEDI